MRIGRLIISLDTVIIYRESYIRSDRVPTLQVRASSAYS
jgi:hypothetical protein